MKDFGKVLSGLILLVILLFFSTTKASAQEFSCNNVTQIPQQECEALISFYNSTSGSNWSYKRGWLESNFPCTWGGVECETGHVVRFYSFGQYFDGFIPADLANLSRLRFLYLTGGLSGSIPPELGNLSSLTHLTLSGTQLTGNIPPQLGNLVNLQELNLGRNHLTGSIPPELGKLINLRWLVLDYNQLSGNIPPELGNLTNLNYLYLTENQLTGNIPSELGKLSNLKVLDFINNQLSGSIPPDLGNLSSLTDFYANYNHLSGNIPAELGKLTNLVFIELSANNLSGSIPPELGNLPNLIQLYLDINQLSGEIPSELGRLPKLDTLDLSSNKLSGNIPPELADMPNLGTLLLNANALEGEVPQSLTRLTNLAPGTVSLAYNMLKADNPITAAFLNEQEPDWAQTQTVPPNNLTVSLVGHNSASLSWTPIEYAGDGGYYIIYSSNTPGGPYTQVGTTIDKLAANFQVNNLLLGRTYYFVVRSYTPSHNDQQNNLLSINSFEVNLTTPQPIQAIQEIITTVESFNLQQGIENNLDAKLQNAVDTLNAENAGLREDAVNKLQAFIQAVEAQRGNKITNEQADILVNNAQTIINSLQNP